MKSAESDELYLRHIVESSLEIVLYSKGMRKKDFLKDHKTQDAMIRRFEIIGEATKKLTEKTRREEASIPWKRIAGMRDRLIHDYFSVDLDLVWQTAKTGLPPLIKAVNRLLEKQD